MNEKTKSLSYAGITAALYVVLTMVSTALGLSSGAIQVRFSEALCILPCFWPCTIPGLFVGCLISNILSGCVLWDVIFGSIATLIGACGAWKFGKYGRFAAVLPNIISNSIIIPFVLAAFYQTEMAIPLLVLTVGIGEIISSGIFGSALYEILKKSRLAA